MKSNQACKINQPCLKQLSKDAVFPPITYYKHNQKEFTNWGNSKYKVSAAKITIKGAKIAKGKKFGYLRLI